MELSNIKRIEDLTLMNDVNGRLESGWILIDTYTNTYDPQAYPSDNTIHYVLGLPDGVEYIEIPQSTNYSSSDVFNDYNPSESFDD